MRKSNHLFCGVGCVGVGEWVGRGVQSAVGVGWVDSVVGWVGGCDEQWGPGGPGALRVVGAVGARHGRGVSLAD